MASRSEYLQIRVTPGEKSRLRRLAKAAGQDVSRYVLSRVLPAAQQRFEELVGLLADADGEPRYVLAELNDLLSSLGREELHDAVAHVELSPLSPFLKNYVAAMVEQASHLKGVRPPIWAARVAPLAAPYWAAPLERLRLHLLRASPVAFKRRNIFVDATIGQRV
jgi:uncharacterized protein (DUF1778 family)